MTTEQQVAEQYRHGALERAILDTVAASGRGHRPSQLADLSGVDEFHLGWRA